MTSAILSLVSNKFWIFSGCGPWGPDMRCRSYGLNDNWTHNLGLKDGVVGVSSLGWEKGAGDDNLLSWFVRIHTPAMPQVPSQRKQTTIVFLSAFHILLQGPSKEVQTIVLFLLRQGGCHGLIDVWRMKRTTEPLITEARLTTAVTTSTWFDAVSKVDSSRARLCWSKRRARLKKKLREKENICGEWGDHKRGIWLNGAMLAEIKSLWVPNESAD